MRTIARIDLSVNGSYGTVAEHLQGADSRQTAAKLADFFRKVAGGLVDSELKVDVFGEAPKPAPKPTKVAKKPAEKKKKLGRKIFGDE